MLFCTFAGLDIMIHNFTSSLTVAQYNPVIYNNLGEVPNEKKDSSECVKELLSAFLDLLKADWLAAKGKP